MASRIAGSFISPPLAGHPVRAILAQPVQKTSASTGCSPNPFLETATLNCHFERLLAQCFSFVGGNAELPSTVLTAHACEAVPCPENPRRGLMKFEENGLVW